MKPLGNTPSFARKGFTMHPRDVGGIGPTLGQENVAAGLPKGLANPTEAEVANPMPEAQAGIPQPQNRIGRYGQ
jgi:hypothetical protein